MEPLPPITAIFTSRINTSGGRDVVTVKAMVVHDLLALVIGPILSVLTALMQLIRD